MYFNIQARHAIITPLHFYKKSVNSYLLILLSLIIYPGKSV